MFYRKNFIDTYTCVECGAISKKITVHELQDSYWRCRWCERVS